MTQKRKLRLYALFQFFSFLSILLLSLAVLSFTIAASEHGLKVDSKFWGEVFSEMLQFSTNEVVGTFSSLLVYISLVFWITTWPIGWLVVKFSDRNLFDQMFLLFLIVPAISNLFALLAQIYQDSVRFTKEKLTAEEVREQHTQILNLLEANKGGIEKEVTKTLKVTKAPKTYSKIKTDTSSTNINKALTKQKNKEKRQLAKVEKKNAHKKK